MSQHPLQSHIPTTMASTFKKLRGNINSTKFPKKILSDGTSTNNKPKGFQSGY